MDRVIIGQIIIAVAALISLIQGYRMTRRKPVEEVKNEW